MKRWLVRTEYLSAIQGWMILKLPPSDLARFRDRLQPTVKETLYRWRWMARLMCFSDNSFNAFNPASIFGIVRSTLHDTASPPVKES